MNQRTIALPSLALLALAAVGCEAGSSLTSNDIVSTIPWEVPEVRHYRVLDDEDEEVGTLDMSIEEQGPGNVRLTQYFDFPEAGFINEAVVIADAGTLEPLNTSFDIEGPDGNLSCDASYTGAEVVVDRRGEDGERTDDLDVPAFAYDSWSDLFLWRTIAFSPGYDERYTDILACTLDRTQKIGVGLEVVDEEEVTVPAGTFEAWKLEIDSGGANQRAWFAKDDVLTLVKYDNGRETFELLPD